jgi:hypothetical protein
MLRMRLYLLVTAPELGGKALAIVSAGPRVLPYWLPTGRCFH